MEFFFQYPEVTGTQRDLTEAGPPAEIAKIAEDAGWLGFAFTEHPIPGTKWLQGGGHQTLDPFVALGAVAAVTTRMRLVTYLAVVPYRNPLLLAKSAATVDKLSNGRFILGVGTGYQKSEFFALGVDIEERNALMDEALEVLPLHWKGESFSYKGLHFEARDVIALPKPVQNPIPIWIGGNAKVTRTRIAEKANGWMPLLGPPELNTTARTPQLGDLSEFSDKVAEMNDVAAKRGVKIEVLYPYLDQSVGEPTKDVERHKEAFAQLEAAGATSIMIPGFTPDRDTTVAFLEGFGESFLK